MEINLAEAAQDPRIRRTRNLLQRSLSTLLESKSFPDISITDICREADIARVTFYQHYDSKEALLVAGVAEFFASMYQAVDQDGLTYYFETGEMGKLLSSTQINVADPSQIRLVKVALTHTGSVVRQLAINSFLESFSNRETALNEDEVQLMGTFYVGGVLTLLEQFLNGRMTVSPDDFQASTLTLLRALRFGVIEKGILSSEDTNQ